jgi:hypothetical protein
VQMSSWLVPDGGINPQSEKKRGSRHFIVVCPAAPWRYQKLKQN